MRENERHELFHRGANETVQNGRIVQKLEHQESDVVLKVRCFPTILFLKLQLRSLGFQLGQTRCCSTCDGSRKFDVIHKV